jgi:colanic acid biosynthesis protein WcaH
MPNHSPLTTNHQFLPTEVFANVVTNTPLIAIDLIVKNDAGEVLLGKRLNAPAKGFWFTPGGRIYKNESMADAFVRIARDELGIKATIDQASFIGTFEHFYEDSVFGDHISTHYVVLAYTLTLPTHLFTNHSSLITKNQHNDYRWQAIDSLRADDSVHTHVKWYFEKIEAGITLIC